MLQASELLKQAANKPALNPNIVLEIEGYDRIFSISSITTLARIGDEGLFIGDDWVIGGTIKLQNVDSYITLDGSTTTVGQQLNQDKGGASSVSSIQISLLDQNEDVTRLISPSFELEEIMGKRAWVYLGLKDESLNLVFPSDYPVLFAGVIDDITAGSTITINVSHPEQKKRQDIYPVIETETVGSITNSQTTIPLKSVDNLLNEKLPELMTYVRIDEEIIRYTGIDTVNKTITGCTRAQFGTIAATHDDQASVATFYRLQDNAIDLALKLMLSGGDTYFYQDIAVSNFVTGFDGNPVTNALFFAGVDVKQKYGFTVGDLITTTGASNGANNFTDKQITSIVTSIDGSVVVVSGVSLTAEVGTAATLKIKSQYNVLPDGVGMGGDQIDIEEFQRIATIYAGQIHDYDFYITDTIKAKEFIDQEVLYPANIYSIPRKGKISLGVVSPPLAVATLPVLDSSCLINPDKIRVRRSLGKYFYNTVSVRYDFDAVETDKPLAGYIAVNEDSRNRIKIGSRSYNVTARGLRRSSNTDNILDINSRRILDRYSFAAEFITCEVNYNVGFTLDVGDVVLFGSNDMPLVDSKLGKRGFEPRLCEIVDRKLDIKSGRVSLTLVDTNCLVSGRYGIVSPSSRIGSGSTTTSLVITESFGTVAPQLERDKWTDYIGEAIVIHNDDYTIRYDSRILGFDPSDSSKLLIQAVSTPPVSGMVVKVPDYPSSTDAAINRTYKNIFVFTNPTVFVDAPVDSVSFDVDPSDVSKFLVGATIEVHNFDYTNRSGELRVLSVSGNTITTSSDLGFTPQAGDLIDFIGYPDFGDSYRFL